MDPDKINLKDYGIDVGLLISGLFGAILLTSKGAAMNLTRTISSLVGGAASANYVTPVVVNITGLDNSHYHYGIAFLLGFLGLKGVEYFSSNLEAVGYNNPDKSLDVLFRNGGEYRYFDVPKSLFQRIQHVKSPGKFFHKHIKKDNPYRYEKLIDQLKSTNKPPAEEESVWDKLLNFFKIKGIF